MIFLLLSCRERNSPICHGLTVYFIILSDGLAFISLSISNRFEKRSDSLHVTVMLVITEEAFRK